MGEPMPAIAERGPGHVLPGVQVGLDTRCACSAWQPSLLAGRSLVMDSN